MKPPLEIISVAFLAAAVCGALVQRNALSNVHQENQKLRGESEEVRRLARENAEIERLRAENAEIEKLRLETRDLHKLRNEVHQLRQSKPDFEKLRAVHERLQPLRADAKGFAAGAQPADRITKETLSALAGPDFTSPEATVRTYFQAIRTGNWNDFRNCFSPEIRQAMDAQFEEQFHESAKQMSARFQSARIAAKRVVSADKVELGLEVVLEEDAPSSKLTVPIKRIGSEWKMDAALF
ncbi:MAG: hypothetical protein DME21_04910 [Verrucomicrobia bacterium]|nr:MAG: hypothetical protein DME21_04910 [Verrucomicrobiota bacterium]